MVLLDLIRKEMKESPGVVLGLLLVTSLSNALLLKTINDAADDIHNGQIVLEHFLTYLAYAAIYIFSRHYIFDKFFLFVEEAVTSLQDRLGDKIRKTELSTLEKVGEATIYAGLTEDMTYLSMISWSLAKVIHSIFVIASVLIYIAVLSFSAFLLVSFGVIIAILNYVLKADQAAKNYFNLSKKEADFLEKLNDIFKGFKELKINRQKSDRVFKDYKKKSALREKARVESFIFYNKNTSFAYICFFVMITTIIFILPQYQEEYTHIIIKITAAILFIFGPIESLLNAFPPVAITEYAAQNILKLEKKLDTALKLQPKIATANQASSSFIPFEKNIHLEGLYFEYASDSLGRSFHIGPMTLNFKKGEIIFITGGNGSGKSTFLKMLIGLYLPKKGGIFIDQNLENQQEGVKVTADNYVQYRNFFTTIFTDYHLFERLYGVQDVNPIQVQELLKSMDLSKDKTDFRAGRFTNTNLSSGQKKRLVLTTSILENKDIYVFDEVASDLDPDFRDIYYYEILGELKARNKMIFVVSHDEEYWEVADRIFEFKNGQVKEKNIK